MIDIPSFRLEDEELIKWLEERITVSESQLATAREHGNRSAELTERSRAATYQEVLNYYRARFK